MAAKWYHHESLATNDCGITRDQPNSCDMLPANFPKGLRVLIFDEDPEYLLKLESDLQDFHYKVTSCDEEDRAMYLLCNHHTQFDVAIIDVTSSGSNRIKDISEIGSKIDLPIIIMSKDDSVESVVKWMTNGACDYLIKPDIRREDLRLIFKHVAKKIQGSTSLAPEEANERAFVKGEKSLCDTDYSDMRNPKKRNSGQYLLEAQIDEEAEDQERDLTPKKRRVVWDRELHQKFLDAVETLGIDNAVPKKILELMNVQGLSRENVASHLQKFRLNMKKNNDQNKRDLQKGNMCDGEEAKQVYNVDFPSHQPNNILQSSWIQGQELANSNITTQLITSFQHHDDALVAFPDRNQVMTQQFNHQTLEPASVENIEGSLGHNNFEMHNEEESEVANLTSFFTQSDEIGFFLSPDPLMANTIITTPHMQSSVDMMHIHDTGASVFMPSFQSSSYVHGSFHNRQ